MSKIAILSFLNLSAFVTGFPFEPALADKEPKLVAQGYRQPTKEILEVLRAPSLPRPLMSPSKDRVLLVAMKKFPSIDRVATPFLRLAGVRIEPKNHSKHDTPGGYGIPPCAQSFELLNLSDGQQKRISIEKLTCVESPIWSADGKHFAFTNRAENGVELWIGQVRTAKIYRVPEIRLNPMFGTEFQWLPDQRRVLVKLVPKDLGPMPRAPIAAPAPTIQEAHGEKGLSSTYERRDTLSNAYDEKLFEYFGTSQLAVVDVETTRVTPVGKPGLFEFIKPAPDGKHLLVTKIVRPYSYLVTYLRFPKKIEVWDIAQPQKISFVAIADLPLADRVPIHGVPTGPRSFSWRPTDSATLIWAEALDGGDWNVKVEARDKIMLWAHPFKDVPTEIFRTTQRYEGFYWFERREIALLQEYDENAHWTRTFIVNVDNPRQPKRILWDLSSDEEYANPGAPVSTILKNGFWVVRERANRVFLAGTGASPEGDRPFLDRLDLGTLKTERLFRSNRGEYEWFLSFVSQGTDDLFYSWHQSPTDVPNLFKRSLGEPFDANEGEATRRATSERLTQIVDPTPQIRKIKKQLVKYKRADGVDLSFTLYTPANYQEGQRVPTVLYAYPLDYAEAATAGQITGSDANFTQLRGYRLLLLAGYAIIDRAAFPIVGDPKKAYDNYLEQLVANAKAAVDEAVRLGVADPERIGVTGHSHGALMAVNLLVHSDLFRAGVATSGSYNKTLTPFGFQSERRSVWETPEVYRKVSPFFFADRLKRPLLIIHGADDANPGTTPLQANLLFEAVRGNGGVSRLVVLPHEPHWYTAQESNEHEIFEMQQWFDAYL